MRAMILAAGLGTRLRPLTNDRPKALVEVAGRTLLDLTLARLRHYGIHDVLVNTHHFADMVEEYLAAHQNFGMNIAISREESLLDTGGGLKQASWFFLNDLPQNDVAGVPHISPRTLRGDVGSDHPEDPPQPSTKVGVPHPSRAFPGWVGSPQPEDSPTACDHREHQRPEAASACVANAFLLHNVDILSTIDLTAMLRHHVEHNALATLATQHRPTSRYLLFDQEGQLCGRQSGPLSETLPDLVCPTLHPEPQAFAGIHILSSRIFSKMTEQGAFPIIPTYLRLAAQGERIQSFNADQYQWRDLGTPESVAAATDDLEGSTSLKQQSS